MLKSTHKPVPLQPLPSGWTEHTSSSGHRYYYNSISGQSTFTRPAAPAAHSVPAAPPAQTQARQAAHAGSSSSSAAPAFQSSHAFSPFSTARTGFNPPFSGNAQKGPRAAGEAGRAPLRDRGRDRDWSQPQGQPQGQSQTRDRERDRDHDRTRERTHDRTGFQNRHFFPRPVDDRPKHKHMIPNCEPWALIVTRLGRRFVHNVETKESYWKFPEYVSEKLAEFERTGIDQESDQKQDDGQAGSAAAASSSDAQAAAGAARNPAASTHDSDLSPPLSPAPAGPVHTNLVDIPLSDDDDLEYEKVEAEGNSSDGSDDDEEDVEYEYVYEDDGESSDDGVQSGLGSESNLLKRQRTAEPLEFTEDDFAFQLAGMDDYSALDSDGTGDDEADDDDDGGQSAAGRASTDGKQAFLEFLSSVEPPINPFDSFDHVVSTTHPGLPLGPGYSILRTRTDREDGFKAWAAVEARRRRQRRIDEQKSAKTDPMVEYLNFLNQRFVGNPTIILSTSSSADENPTLFRPRPVWKTTKKAPYWPEVKRKYRKEPAFRDGFRFSTDEREKAFRDFASVISISPVQLADQLDSVLKDNLVRAAALDDGLLSKLDELLRIEKVLLQNQAAGEDTGDDRELELVDSAFEGLLPVTLCRSTEWAVVPHKARMVMAKSTVNLLTSKPGDRSI